MSLISEPTNINLYFGQRNQVTLEKFDHLSEKLRRSRTGTLDFLITHYEWFEKHKKEVIASKSISIPAVTHAMLQELSDKNRKKPDQYLHELIKREYDKKK
jgi:hypothetical protein